MIHILYQHSPVLVAKSLSLSCPEAFDKQKPTTSDFRGLLPHTTQHIERDCCSSDLTHADANYRKFPFLCWDREK